MFFKLKKRIIKLRSKLIRSREERRVWFDSHLNKVLAEEVAEARWGVSYSVFDGEELLEASIRSIKDEVDYINVVYQTKSWYGKPAAEGLLPLLQKLRADGLIDELIEYVPDVRVAPGKQETRKRNMGLKSARKAGVHYFMTMDCDEFYTREDLRFAKEYIVKHQITQAYCNIINYGQKPTQRLAGVSNSYVQIFSRIHWNSVLESNKRIVTLIDPTRQLGHNWLYANKYYFLPRVAMHHMSLIRKDLDGKMENSSNAAYLKENPMKREFSDGEYVRCPDVFNIGCIN